jgi:hypothetical protein
MGVFAVVTAVPVHGLAVGGNALVNGVVTPFPNKAAAMGGMTLEELEIILQISGTVTHSVTILTKDEGLVQTFVDPLLHLLNTPESILGWCFDYLLIIFLGRGAAQISTDFRMDTSIGDIITGIILLFIIGCEFFMNYKIHLRKKAKEETDA